MKRALALSALVILAGCDALSPALRYQEAARQLRFSLDRLEPQVELALPLERSRLRLRLDLGVDNPTEQRLRTRRVGGNLRLAAQGGDHAIGAIGFPEGMDLAPKGRSTLRAEVVLSYADLKQAWGPLSAASLHREPATWSLAGEARFEVMGLEFGVPFRASKASGR